MTLEAKETRTQCGSSTSLNIDCNVSVIDLLDEHWFFKNTFSTRRTPSTDCAYSQGKKRKETDVKCQNHERLTSTAHRDETASLHRMPTLRPRLQRLNTAKDEAVRSLKSCHPKLRHSLSSLDNYQSSSSKNALSSPSTARERPSRYIKLERSERYLAIQHYLVKEAYYRKIFKEKKWRSLSDLEYIEVQGFKDLGFVFDKEELNASLARVLPGLSNKKPSNGDKITRPYLSEAWLVQKSAPPMFRCSDKRSVEDMKEQLKFWARAVACNARQDY